jgi:hypothetical protein
MHRTGQIDVKPPPAHLPHGRFARARRPRRERAGAIPPRGTSGGVTVVRLRDERRIDDTVLRQIQARLDTEEVRLSRREVVD